MLQIPFISTIGGSHSDHSASNALGGHTGERKRKREEKEKKKREGEQEGLEWKWDGVWREGGELPPDISHSGGAALRCCDQSQPQNRHVLVSSLSALSLIFISVLKRQDMFFYASRSPPSFTFASSTFTLPHSSARTPPPLCLCPGC